MKPNHRISTPEEKAEAREAQAESIKLSELRQRVDAHLASAQHDVHVVKRIWSVQPAIQEMLLKEILEAIKER